MKPEKKGLEIKSSWYKKILYVIIIAIIIYSLFHFGFIKKNCKQDRECFYEAAKTCKPAKLINVQNGNYYNYIIKGKRGGTCLIYVELKKMAPGSALDQRALFEGKDMTCSVPISELEQTSFAELKGFITYCHGSLKEAIYEQIIAKMYGLVVKNMQEIIEAGTEAIT